MCHLFIRIVDAKKPIESEINSQDKINDLRVVFHRWLKKSVEYLNDLRRVEISIVLTFQSMFVEYFNGITDFDQINFKNEEIISSEYKKLRERFRFYYAKVAFVKCATSLRFDRR